MYLCLKLLDKSVGIQGSLLIENRYIACFLRCKPVLEIGNLSVFLTFPEAELQCIVTARKKKKKKKKIVKSFLTIRKMFYFDCYKC